MPLIIDGGRVPTRWAEKASSRPVVSIDRSLARAKSIKIAFVNNMPDPALEDTELQFFELLDAASDNTLVFLKLYSLNGIPRTGRGQPHLNDFYFGIEDLWRDRFDAAIVTGTEPHHADLREEPYWGGLVDVFDWAERNTVSTVLSCLAAHAGVLYSDGVQRCPLNDKRFGVFESRRIGNHALTARIEDGVRFPHSRWNEVRADDLTSTGYEVLLQSELAGVDLFAKEKKKCLFVHFQGHPEYGALTLLKEYRRDIKRFLRRERETYPIMPHEYFSAAGVELLTGFREEAVRDRQEEVMKSFPEALVVDTLQNTWHSSAVAVYRSWLQYVLAKKAESVPFVVMADVSESPRRRSAVS
jgi:homoserine O-succinyltransferase